MLENALRDIGFDHANDRLFAVGDLIDRGPESMRAIEFMAKPWFFSVRGNHDELPHAAAREMIDGRGEMLELWVRNGGDWFYDHSFREIGRLSNALMDLPVMIEVETIHGLVGVVHAEPSIGDTWADIRQRLHDGCRKTATGLMWNRDRMDLMKAGQKWLSHYKWSVHGIDHVFTGHSVVKQPWRIGNLHFIDTGACFEGGAMTIIEIGSDDGFVPHVTPRKISK